MDEPRGKLLLAQAARREVGPTDAAQRMAPHAGWWGLLRRFARRQPVGFASLVYLVAMIAIAFLAPVVAPHPPLDFVGKRLEAPGAAFVMGTDDYGRDVLSRLVWGARISLEVGLISTAITVVVALVLGLVCSASGAWVDMAVQRVVDGIMAFPVLLILITLMLAAGPGVVNVAIVLGVAYGVRNSRVVRAEAIRLAATPMVAAARAMGAGNVRVIARHLLPNLVPVLLVVASLTWGRAVLAEAQLSFLGFGVPPPEPSWGVMVAGGGREFFEAAPWIALFPGLAISLTVYAFNMLGDALRDEVDPTLREQ